MPSRLAQSVARLIKESHVLGSIPGPVTYFRFSLYVKNADGMAGSADPGSVLFVHTPLS